MRSAGIRNFAREMKVVLDSGDVLAITNNGVLVGVLIPLTKNSLDRLARRDESAIEASVDRAAQPDADMVSDAEVDALLRREAIEEWRPEQRSFDHVGVRQLNGERVAEAQRTGTTILVTSDRRPVALLIPAAAPSAEKLAEQIVRDFLDGPAVPDAVLVPAGGSRPRPPGGSALRGAIDDRGPRAKRERIIGIRIVGDTHNGNRLVGVVTDDYAEDVFERQHYELKELTKSAMVSGVLTLVSQLAETFRPDEELVGVGVEVGGHVHDGRIVYSVNNHLSEFPILDYLSGHLDVPFHVENDANALAAYHRWVRGRDGDFAVVLLTHEGLGCGLVLNDDVYRGSHGLAGELGHVCFPGAPEGEPDPNGICRCGSIGCLERAATPSAISAVLGGPARYQDAIRAFSDRGEQVDEHLRGVFAVAGASLGYALLSLINTLNLSAVILVGPLELVGPGGRSYHVDNRGFPEAEAGLPGSAAVYLGAMYEVLRHREFSTAMADCIIQVEKPSNKISALAAAACFARYGRRAAAESHHERTGGARPVERQAVDQPTSERVAPRYMA